MEYIFKECINMIYKIVNDPMPNMHRFLDLQPNIHGLLEQGQILHGLLDPGSVGVNKKRLWNN
jgi:hypothetical protein